MKSVASGLQAGRALCVRSLSEHHAMMHNTRLCCLFLHHGKQVVFFHDQQLVAIDLDGLTTVFAKQTRSPTLTFKAITSPLSFLRLGLRRDFTLIRLFSRGVGDHNARGGLGFASIRLTITRSCGGTKFHSISLNWGTTNNA